MTQPDGGAEGALAQSEALLKVQTGTAKRLAERLEQTEAALRVAVEALEKGYRLAGKTWSEGMGFNAPPSPREWKAWRKEAESVLTDPATSSLRGEA